MRICPALKVIVPPGLGLSGRGLLYLFGDI